MFRTSRPVRIAATGLVALLATAPAALATAGTTSAKPAAHVVLARGLANPRQLAVAPDGTLYAALAGTGRWHAHHKGGCSSAEGEGVQCAGDTGGVERVKKPGSAKSGAGRRVLRGVFSLGDQGSSSDPAGSNAVGLDAVSFAPDGTEYGIVTVGPKSTYAGLPGSVRKTTGRLVRIRKGVLHDVADVANFTYHHPQPGHFDDADPYGVLALRHRVFVADAADNSVVVVSGGKIRKIHQFPGRNGDGEDGSYDSVPTSLATDGKHLFVGTLAAFIPGKAQVVEMTFAGKIIRTINGLTTVTSIAVGRGGVVYATDLSDGLVLSLHPDGKRHQWHVPAPGGVAVAGGHLYVSVNTTSPTHGQIWRLR